jgi:hypothetical protein
MEKKEMVEDMEKNEMVKDIEKKKRRRWWKIWRKEYVG